MSGSNVPAIKDALVTALTGLYPTTTLVCNGTPGTYQPDEVVAVMGARTPISRPTMGTNRSREEHATIDVVFSVFVAGGPEAQQTATDRAYAMAGQLSDYFRTTPNERLGGLAQDAWVAEYDETPSVAIHPDTGDAMGRVCELTALVVVRARP